MKKADILTASKAIYGSEQRGQAMLDWLASHQEPEKTIDTETDDDTVEEQETTNAEEMRGV